MQQSGPAGHERVRGPTEHLWPPLHPATELVPLRPELDQHPVDTDRLPVGDGVIDPLSGPRNPGTPVKSQCTFFAVMNTSASNKYIRPPPPVAQAQRTLPLS
jgi:hypothetical protein